MKNLIMSVFIIIVLLLIPTFAQATIDNPIVTAIQITSPKTGIYGEGQTIYINVYFDKKITGEIPTLKIKFGEGIERNMINGTIHNDTNVSTYGQYIQYSYNIQLGDNGYFTTVGLEGGNIKDIDGNEAILSCPELTGNISIEAKTDEVEETEDDTEEESTAETDTTKDDTEEESTAETDTTKGKTVKSGNLPYTGIVGGILVAFAIVLIIGIISKIKYNRYKDI